MSEITFKAGDVLNGRYVVIDYFTAGSMQLLYRCHDTALNRVVVLKTPKDRVKDRRFKRGAEMGAQVNHPNVAATFDYYEDENVTFLIEEYIEGIDLQKRLENEFLFMDPSLAAHVIQHIARALYEAHKLEICHRDLKPSNVMTSPDAGLASIKLTDFGIAKLAESEIDAEIIAFNKDNSTLTSSTTLLGAIPYMAPECWTNWKKAGKPMDVWALGCIAYELVAGEPPFGMGRVAIKNVTKAEMAGQVELPQPASFGKHPNTGPLEMELMQLILNCLKIIPEERPTALQVLQQCNDLRYANSPRKTGTIESYRIPLSKGGTMNGGYIRADDQTRVLYHRSEYFGIGFPLVNQRVNFASYPGEPFHRCSPVLQLRPPLTA